MSIAINNTAQKVVSFKSKSEETTQPKPSDDGNKISNTTKAMIGTGLLALAAVGVYIATRGRSKLPTTPSGENPISQPLGLVVEEFKKAGNKFVKGKAILADGTNYTGNIIKNNKDGSKLVLEYADGVIQKSTKTNKSGETVFEKTFKYTDNGMAVYTNKNGHLDTYKRIVDKQGNTHMYIYKYEDKGVFSVNKEILIDKKNNIIMHHESPYAAMYYDLNSGKKGARVLITKFEQSSISAGMCENPKIRGVNVLEHCKQERSSQNNSGLRTFYTDTQLSHPNGEDFAIRNSYRFTPDGKHTRKVTIYTDKCQYRVNSGEVFMEGHDNPIFKYNPKTKEITELKIDEKQAKEIVESAEKQYDLIKRATNTHFNKLRTENEVWGAFNKL